MPKQMHKLLKFIFTDKHFRPLYIVKMNWVRLIKFGVWINSRIVFSIYSLDFQMEITNDIQFLLPIMVAIMVAKWVGDFATHPLYHALLELKCIPFLDSEPVILHEGSQA